MAQEALGRAEQAILGLGEEAIQRGFVRLSRVVQQTMADLEKAVQGQAEAIRQVVDALYRAKHPPSYGDARRRPAMVLFFVGPTGVGKNAFAKATTGKGGHLALINGTKALVMTAIDIVTDPEHTQQMKATHLMDLDEYTIYMQGQDR